MTIFFELLNEIDRYLIGVSSDRDLESWVVANLQRILDSGDTGATHLANEVDALFIDMGESIIDQATLINRLDSLVRKARTLAFEFAESTVLIRNEIAGTSDTVSFHIESMFTPA